MEFRVMGERAGSRFLALAAVAAAVAACDQPRFRKFQASVVKAERTFGQLYDDSGTLRVSHHLVVELTAPLRTPATGTVEFIINQDGLQDCLLLRPKKYLTTPNNFSGLVGLPKPGNLVLAFCHLDRPTVETQIAARYTAILGDAAEGAIAATRFMAHEPSFQRVDVVAHDSDLTQSTALGTPAGGRLHVAAFTRREDVTTYVNPLPYLAVAFPGAEVDVAAPQIDQVMIETSDTPDFATPTAHDTTSSEPALGQRHARFVVRFTEQTTVGGVPVIPYKVGYSVERLTLSGTTVVGRFPVSRGESLFNTVGHVQTATLAQVMYGATPPTQSVPPNGPFWLRVPWDPADPAPTTPVPRDALAAGRALAVDLQQTSAAGAPLYPIGTYEAVISIADTVHPPTTRTVRFTITTGGSPPGDAEIQYTPSAGPLGTEIVLTAATADAFEDGRTTVTFNGTFDPDGEDGDGNPLAATPAFTVTYPVAAVRVIDGNHAAVRLGSVKPPLAILDSSTMRFGQPGRLSGSLTLHTDRTSGTPYDHVLATSSFAVTAATRVGQVVDGAFVEASGIDSITATTPAEVLATPDFERVAFEQRLVDTSGAPPATITVQVRSLDDDGVFAGDEAHELGLVGLEAGLAIYRSGHGGGRMVVFVDDPALAGPHGSDLLAVFVPDNGSVRLDGAPP